jgi:hypothetical protein
MASVFVARCRPFVLSFASDTMNGRKPHRTVAMVGLTGERFRRQVHSWQQSLPAGKAVITRFNRVIQYPPVLVCGQVVPRLHA